MALVIMKGQEHARVVFMCLLFFLRGMKKSLAFSVPVVIYVKKGWLFALSLGLVLRGWFHLSHPLPVQLLVLALVKQSLVLLRERTSEHVTRLFPEPSVWSSKIGSGCNQKMSKCLLRRSKEDSSTAKIALSSKGKAAWQPLINKEVRTNPGFAKYYLFFLFFSYSYRLSENNCETCLEVYVQNICFAFGTHLIIERKEMEKYQEGQITVIYIQKFVCFLGEQGLKYFYAII